MRTRRLADAARNGDAEQIVGRERRERVSQLAWCGEGCFDSRRRVNSNVRRLTNEYFAHHSLCDFALPDGRFGVGSKAFFFDQPNAFKHPVDVPRAAMPIVTTEIASIPGCDERPSKEPPSFEAS